MHIYSRDADLRMQRFAAPGFLALTLKSGQMKEAGLRREVEADGQSPLTP